MTLWKTRLMKIYGENVVLQTQLAGGLSLHTFLLCIYSCFSFSDCSFTLTVEGSNIASSSVRHAAIANLFPVRANCNYVAKHFPPQCHSSLFIWLHLTTFLCICILQMIKYWRWLRPGNKAYHSTLYIACTD